MGTESPAIEVDPAMYEDSGEDYAKSGYDTSTASLTSSINAYLHENGRRYHQYYGADKNLQPTDETEQDRLDLHHAVMSLLLDGKLHLAPLDAPQRILDIGTGTGIWAIDVADEYPMAEVIGTDLSPIQPRWVPPNCRFEVDDAELDWTYKENFFDFIHIRNIAQAIGDWEKLLKQAYKHTKPGGYVELCECGGTFYSDDNSLPPDHGSQRFCLHLQDALAKLGRPRQVDGEYLTTHLAKAGFVDVQVTSRRQPMGPWAKDKKLKQVGAMCLLAADSGYHSYGMAAFTRILNMTPEEATKICDDGVKATRNKNYHGYNIFYVAYGRKPEEEKR